MQTNSYEYPPMIRRDILQIPICQEIREYCNTMEMHTIFSGLFMAYKLYAKI